MIFGLDYFQPEELEDIYTIKDPQECKHLATVKRIAPGERVQITNGRGDYLEGIVDSASKKNIAIRIERKWHQKDSRIYSVYIGLPKKEYWEEVLRWSSVLQVKKVYGFRSERSQKFMRNIDRENKILIEALKQSGGAFLPKIEILENLDCSNLGEGSIFLDLASEGSIKKDEWKKIKNILIGPEGGWTESERSLFQEHGISPGHLPFGTLRTADVLPVALSYLAANQDC